jgi:hypothetical protein
MTPSKGCNPLQWKEVNAISEHHFRKWMVLIAAATLLVAIIRLWIG